MFIQAFDGSQYCCVNDKDIYRWKKYPSTKQNQRLRYRLYSAKTKAPHSTMNHPWRRQQFGKFVKQQEHHQNDQDTKNCLNEAHQYNKPQQKANYFRTNTQLFLQKF